MNGAQVLGLLVAGMALTFLAGFFFEAGRALWRNLAGG